MERFLYKRNLQKSPKINLWFCYGAIENFAMASLGYLSIFKDLDLNPNLFVERVYQDTHTTQIPPKDVDCMGFSISFELDILTIIKMLQKYNFPLKSKDRTENDPIVFAGGPVMMSNPFPYEEFFDFISIGEKTALKEAFKILENKNEYARDEILKQLSNVEGIYVPKYPKKVEITRDNLEQEIIYTPILSDNSFFKDTFIIEIERGCPKMCNFCLASWLNLPARFVPYEKIIEAIDLGLKHTNKIALLGAYVAGHPDFKKIIKYIASKENVELSVSSLRADLADKDLIETLVKCGQKTATIALEAGSQRLRDLIKKDLTSKQILKTVSDMQKYGLKGVKIYTMLGLPDENDEDIEELINLIKEMKNNLKGKGAFNICVSSSTFIPKIHTPFENVERAEKNILEKRIKYLKKTFHKMGIDYRSSSVEWDIIQSILSRYPDSLADFLIDVVKEGANLGAFKKTWRAYNKKGLLPDFEFCAKAPLNNIKTLKWDLIETGVVNLKEKRYDTFLVSLQ
ncbi:MAG: radical SAM protein [Candidatus Gastranaerophilales bacterium]|nr:radical SAM protein [Candidatus Gastranaerophilales bacterium]